MGTNYYLATTNKDVKERYFKNYSLTDEPVWAYEIHIAKISGGCMPPKALPILIWCSTPGPTGPDTTMWGSPSVRSWAMLWYATGPDAASGKSTVSTKTVLLPDGTL